MPPAWASDRVQFRKSMSRWQKRARLAVAVVGVGALVAVYTGSRSRPAPPPVAPPIRLDPKALVESSGNVVQQVRGTRQEFVVKAAQQLTYEGGATRLMGVEIAVGNRGGRDYVIRTRQAQAGERQEELQLLGEVRLRASDGFQLGTEEAFFSQADGRVRAPGAFTFDRTTMSGAGVGMTYERDADVLSIADASEVRLRDEAGNTVTQFLSGSTVFARGAHTLDLDRTVHVLHDAQVIDAAHALAHLSEDDARVTRIELRGRAEVGGAGSGLDRLRAEEIDLDYAEDGLHLTRVALRGEATVVLAADEGAAARRVSGNVLDITLADDGSVSALRGRDGVRLDLGGEPGTPQRTIRARTLDAGGQKGRGLTKTTFRDSVVYREDGQRAGLDRTIRARELEVVLEDDAIDSAVFSGAVRFEERGLQAAGAELLYEPRKGSIRVSGADSGGTPRVADETVTVEAAVIDMTIEGRRMSATGGVKTQLQTTSSATRVPGLLEAGQVVNVNAARFDYDGAAGRAVYAGDATLWQGQTAIRGERIVLDQSKGDLSATGGARSTLKLDTGMSLGRGNEITYLEAERTVTYVGDKRTPAQLSGAQGDLRAGRIQAQLASARAGAGGKLDRLQADSQISLSVDRRTVSGEHLTYFAMDERYVVTGSAAVPVKVVEPCRETTGRTLTFFKSADRIVVDGNEEVRTQSTGGGACSGAGNR